MPIVNRFLKHMQIQRILEDYLPADDRRIKLPPAHAIALLLRNLMVARKPLYALGEWAEAEGVKSPLYRYHFFIGPFACCLPKSKMET